MRSVQKTSPPIKSLAAALLAILVVATFAVRGEDAKQEKETPKTEKKAASRLISLSKEHSIWIDVKRKIVVVDGEVAVREGALEMFACPKGTKEHESVIAVHCNGQLIHAGLLAVGAKQGHPVRFDPKYEPATGTAIDIWILWQDDEGRHRVRAQDWVQDVKTEKALQHDWVFGGSGFWTDETDGKKYYHADAGDLICVSNFSTAMLDLPVESSQANDARLYVAFTEKIPPRGTKIRMVLSPKKGVKDQAKKGVEKKASEASNTDDSAKGSPAKTDQ